MSNKTHVFFNLFGDFSAIKLHSVAKRVINRVEKDHNRSLSCIIPALEKTIGVPENKISWWEVVQEQYEKQQALSTQEGISLVIVPLLWWSYSDFFSESDQKLIKHLFHSFTNINCILIPKAPQHTEDETKAMVLGMSDSFHTATLTFDLNSPETVTQLVDIFSTYPENDIPRILADFTPITDSVKD